MLPGVEESEKSAGGLGEELSQEMSRRQATKVEQAKHTFRKEVIIKLSRDCREFASGFAFSRCCRDHDRG
jgi:hypothetical protein